MREYKDKNGNQICIGNILKHPRFGTGRVMLDKNQSTWQIVFTKPNGFGMSTSIEHLKQNFELPECEIVSQKYTDVV